MIVGIDARMYGLRHAGIGRYVKHLVEDIPPLSPTDTFILFVRQVDVGRVRRADHVEVVVADFRHYTLGEQVGLIQTLHRHKLDLVHFPHFNVPLFFREPFIVTIHDLLWHRVKGLAVTTLSPTTYLLKYLGYRLVARNAIKRSRTIIVPSNFVKHEIKDLEKITEDKITTIYEGVDSYGISSKDKAKQILAKYQISEPYLLYVGNVYPHKNLDRLLVAFSILRKKNFPQFTLVIVSSRNVFLGRLTKAIGRQKLLSAVKLTGFVSDEDLSKIYQQATLVVQPSLSEGFGLTGLEAMALGTPVAAAKSGSLPEIYGEAAVYFDPFNVEEMVEVIGEVVSNFDFRKKLIRLGWQRVVDYSWQTMAKETLKVYKQAVR